jgi:hypothetical protein
MRFAPVPFALYAALLIAATPARVPPAGAGSIAGGARPPSYDDAFWRHWGDGRAELAAYDLTFPRYGAARPGLAVAIFVTETFSNSLRVKSDPGKHPATDEFPVLKLNLVEDFATGIYDYNLLTSAFVALAPANGYPAGAATKIAFSSQEWCGAVYSQARFDADAVRHTLHSYFDGEADRDDSLPARADGLAEDALLMWARDLAGPVLAAGETREVQLMRSLERARLRHQPVLWERATLAREAATRSVTVPAGTFVVETRTVAIAGGRAWTFRTEHAPPHRIVSWESSEGERAVLLASDRLKYWEMNGPGFERALSALGLRPRAARMP